jgi:hypothetical protein
LNDSLGPKTSPAGGKGVSKTVFSVFFDVIAAPAKMTGRKFESADFLSELFVFCGIPDFK